MAIEGSRQHGTPSSRWSCVTPETERGSLRLGLKRQRPGSETAEVQEPDVAAPTLDEAGDDPQRGFPIGAGRITWPYERETHQPTVGVSPADIGERYHRYVRLCGR